MWLLKVCVSLQTTGCRILQIAHLCITLRNLYFPTIHNFHHLNGTVSPVLIYTFVYRRLLSIMFHRDDRRITMTAGD